jgi:hypothetical protein
MKSRKLINMSFGQKNLTLPIVFLPDVENRPSSAPFLSGDTFRNIADFSIEPNGTIESIQLLPVVSKDSLIFVKVDIFHSSQHLNALYSWLEAYKFRVGNGPTFIIHNGDLPPQSQTLKKLVSLGVKVYCVNTPHESDFIHGIPIGLENAHYKKSGQTHLYSDFPNNSELHHEKNRLIFSSFSSKTNPRHRKKLIKKIKQSEHDFSGSSLSLEKYVLEVRRSFFVLSPKGNGLDCHRTWEAVYLGAIPIIPQNVLPQSLIQDLPIWEIQDWDEALQASNEELLQKYHSLKSKPLDHSLFPYWAEKFNRA